MKALTANAIALILGMQAMLLRAGWARVGRANTKPK
jgi:hypothetical protein